MLLIHTMIAFFLFALGTIVGSFLNVCIWRVPRGESVSEPPSHCPRCDTRLRPLDLIPIVSQVVLRARCRYCGAKISWRYAGIEALTGFLFVLAGINSDGFQGAWWNGTLSGEAVHWVQLVQWLLAIACLIVIFWVDYDTLYIPMSAALLLGLAGIGSEAYRVLVAGQTLTPPQIYTVDFLPVPLPHSLVAMVVTASVIWTVRFLGSLVTQKYLGTEAMGFGDVFLTAGIAANLGWHATILTFLFLSPTVGTFAGLAMRIPRAVKSAAWARRRLRLQSPGLQSSTSTRAVAANNFLRSPSLPRALFCSELRRPIPFGPMLAVGALLAMIYGAQINRSYMRWANPDAYATISSMSSSVKTHE